MTGSVFITQCLQHDSPPNLRGPLAQLMNWAGVACLPARGQRVPDLEEVPRLVAGFENEGSDA